MNIKLLFELAALLLILYLLINIFCHSNYEPASVIGELFRALCEIIAGGRK